MPLFSKKPISGIRLYLVLSANVLLHLASPALAGWETFPLRENGTIPVWTVVGPFPNGKPLTHGPGCFGFFEDYLKGQGGEVGCSPAEGDRIVWEQEPEKIWRTVVSEPAGLLDYIRIFRTNKETPGVAYAFCRLVSPTAREAVFKVRSNDGVRVWLNGAQVHENHVGRTIDEGGEDSVRVRLHSGVNPLLVKVDQSQGGWGQRLAVEGPDGNPIRELTVEVNTAAHIAGEILSAAFSTTCLVKKTPEGPRQIVTGHIASGGLTEVVCRLSMKQWATPILIPLGDLPMGEHRVELPIPILVEDGLAEIEVEAESDSLRLSGVPFQQPREWTVYFVQHTHTDIGYTRAQDELLPDFLRQIDHALDYCDLTESYPDEARFRWTCETAWAVREYLKRRSPEQIERLKNRVAEGRIEVTGLYLNMDDIADENALAASLQPIRELRNMGFPVTTAMQNDVPGAAWALVDYLNECGVKSIGLGINNDRTPRPFDRPTAFWWESPSGKRILAWRPDHYHTGNHLRIHQGSVDGFRGNLLEYLETIQRKGYPFDRVAIQFSGMQIDNSPPATTACDLVRDWNETHAWPRLKLAVAGEFLEHVEREWADDLPTYRSAWPNWWTDGFAFAHVETAKARAAHANLNVAQGLLSMASLLGEPIPDSAHATMRQVEENLLFYDEHTFGAQEEFSRPMAENSIVQWGEKVSHVWEAVKGCAMLRETAWGALLGRIRRESGATLAVFNTLAWERSGTVEVYIGHEMLPPNRPARFVDVATGKEVPALLSRSRFEGSYWTLWVSDVPPMGGKTLRIELRDREAHGAPSPDHTDPILENEFYRLVVDPASGTLTSLYDKELGRELVDRGASWGFGQFIRDRLTDDHFHDRESFLERSTRTSLRELSVRNLGEGPLWSSILASGNAEGCVHSADQPGFQCEFRLYRHEKRIEVRCSIRKQFAPEPESIYIAFPFASKEGKVVYEVQGGVVNPETDQIPGSSADWQTFQNFVSVQDQEGQVILTSDQVPLVQLGDINMGKWMDTIEIEKPHVYSWVMNNYWTYNFRGSKESEFTWSYHLTSSRDTSNSSATRFGWSARFPLAATAFPPGGSGEGESSFSTFGVKTPNVLVVNSAPVEEDDSILLHLRELDGKRAQVEFEAPTRKVARIDRTNVLGDILEPGLSSITLEPFEVKFIKLSF
ncbi:MAG: hypothetical protein HUU16_02510 [Candidatus Omnitrophica bacterium]|nr:hypothetical protein [Candidatus Omnitrophota bacterium]